MTQNVYQVTVEPPDDDLSGVPPLHIRVRAESEFQAVAGACEYIEEEQPKGWRASSPSRVQLSSCRFGVRRMKATATWVDIEGGSA